VPLDAICLAAIREELAERITGMKIDKIQQPERDIIILSLRGGSVPSCRLLISAGSGDNRVHLTEHRFENPTSPPMFCMLLRKHLSGARIKGVTQPPSERVLVLDLEAPDVMGDISEKSLVVEMIGRLSNIILTDSDGLIIDCLRRKGGELTDKRPVLPGLLYREPPAQENKRDPMNISKDEWRALFDSACRAVADKSADKWLLATFSAMSPLICREISQRAYGETDLCLGATRDGGAALCREFFSIVELGEAAGYEPWILTDQNDSPFDFSYTRITQYEGLMKTVREESFSVLLDNFFTRSAQQRRIRQRASATEKTVKNARDRLIRKLAAQQAELEKTTDRDKSRECGDIITANLHIMNKGQTVLEAQDFYSDAHGTREIALDPMKTPQQNAARYYKEYTKAKSAEKYLTEQIGFGSKELEYLDSVLEEISLAESEREVGEIREELIRTGYIRTAKQGKEKMVESSPMMFLSSAGLRILAGRNNLQNDKLTLKTASRSDVWLHAQKTHGAHVVISCGGEKPDAATLYEAAAIAAFYSSARSGAKVPVDHTEVRFVKKQPGGRPGMVIYTDYKTIMAIPDGELVERLKR